MIIEIFLIITRYDSNIIELVLMTTEYDFTTVIIQSYSLN